MWEIVSRPDLEQAKEEVRTRRAALLKRHAEELKRLDADRRELEDLARLAGLFSRKFGRKPSQPQPPVRWMVAPATAASTSPATPTRQAAVSFSRRPDRRQRRVEPFSGTNFDMFLRAVTESSF